jgi:hypothetical protein
MAQVTLGVALRANGKYGEAIPHLRSIGAAIRAPAHHESRLYLRGCAAHPAAAQTETALRGGNCHL